VTEGMRGDPGRGRAGSDRPQDASGPRLRVLYSFPHKIGGARINYTAWEQVSGLVAEGVDVTVFPGAVSVALPGFVEVRPTLARGRARIPYKLLGRLRALALHDYVVACRLPELVNRAEIDVVHTWPLGALRTLRVAADLGIPTVLERPNAHTRYAYEVVRRESQRLGVVLPRSHEHAYNEAILKREEAEYGLATKLLCPSDFVLRTFVEQGFSPDRLVRHRYGFDPARFHPPSTPRAQAAEGLTALYVGVAAVRKGLHFALEAWLASPAARRGRFLIVGAFLPAYRQKLAPMLAHPSVDVLGHREDVPELMRSADIFVLPSIEEGYPLAAVEARGSGCVILVSDACDEACKHGINGLVHRVGDVAELSRQMSLLDADRELLERLRAASTAGLSDITWAGAARTLVAAYHAAVAAAPAFTRRSG
jgi:glycosyltransferase involved in cell wall biosynthesis